MPEPTTDERITVDACPKCGAREYDPPRDCEFCESGGHLVPVAYVPESVVDALREENARLKAKGLDDFTVTGDEYDRLLAERDALRARVEELEALLGEAVHIADCECVPDDEWVAESRALLSGGSQEPRPGLHAKYDVRKTATGEEVADCFVLRPGRDPAARAALRAYADATDDLALRDDLCRWVVAAALADGHGDEVMRDAEDRLTEPRPDTDETCPEGRCVLCDGKGRYQSSTGGYAFDGEALFTDLDCYACGGSGRRPDTKETT